MNFELLYSPENISMSDIVDISREAVSSSNDLLIDSISSNNILGGEISFFAPTSLSDDESVAPSIVQLSQIVLQFDLTQSRELNQSEVIAMEDLFLSFTSENTKDFGMFMINVTLDAQSLIEHRKRFLSTRSNRRVKYGSFCYSLSSENAQSNFRSIFEDDTNMSEFVALIKNSEDVGEYFEFTQTVILIFDTVSPSTQPSLHSSNNPSDVPSSKLSSVPSATPSSYPSMGPSKVPSMDPSSLPSLHPSNFSSQFPSLKPSQAPSTQPSSHPSSIPSTYPSMHPSDIPSSKPSAVPSLLPSVTPSASPSSGPSSIPSTYPSMHPSDIPSSKPSAVPSLLPSVIPSTSPSSTPILTSAPLILSFSSNSTFSNLNISQVEALEALLFDFFSTHDDTIDLSITEVILLDQFSDGVMNFELLYSPENISMSDIVDISREAVSSSNDLLIDSISSNNILGGEISFFAPTSLSDIQSVAPSIVQLSQIVLQFDLTQSREFNQSEVIAMEDLFLSFTSENTKDFVIEGL